MTKTIELKLQKSTPGTRVYSTEDPDAVCRTVYLAKAQLPDPPPVKVVLTVAFEVKVPA